MVEDLAAVDFGSLNYAVKRGVEIDDAGERANASQLVLTNRLIAAVHRLNPELSNEQCEQVARTLTRPPHPTLIQNNRWFHNLLTDGVAVEYRDATTGETRGGRARLINFEQPEKNDLLVVRELTVGGPTGTAMRPDLTVFLNGLPIAVIELKDPTDIEADLGVAIDQMDRYMSADRGAPDFFVPNLVLAVSDGLLTRVGSITSGRSRFMPWRPSEGGKPSPAALIRGLFAPALLLEFLRTCVTFEEDARGAERTCAWQHRDEYGRPDIRGVVEGGAARHRIEPARVGA
jgi:type I restriction enzyme R subunit